MIYICFSVFMTWVLWVAAAAAVTQSIGGNLHCRCVCTFSLAALLPDIHCLSHSTQTEFVYCGHLNALIAFAWMIWYGYYNPSLLPSLIFRIRIFLSFLLVAIIVRGVIVLRRGEGAGGGLVDD